MLAIRMQRTGRKGHAEFRIIVQESRRTPTSGAIVTQLGHYNPHAKTIVLDKEKTTFYLEHGAQPSDSVVRLLQKEAIALPSWVKLATTKSRATRNPEKLRKNQPAKPAEPAEAVSSADENASDQDGSTAETPEPTAEVEETPAEAQETSTESNNETASAETETKDAEADKE